MCDWSPQINKIRREFDSFPLGQKISFYIIYRNFHAAIDRVKEMLALDLDQKILLAKLHYWLGKEGAGKRFIADIMEEKSADYKIMNAIGNFYLFSKIIRYQQGAA